MVNKLCVYTVLIGDYEQLTEQPVFNKSNVDFICFTDNKNLTSPSWTIRYVSPIFPMDAARSSRLIKICPHRFLKEYDISLYIDNSIELKKTPEDIYRDLMIDDEVEMISIKHSLRETLLDEFVVVIQYQLDNLNTILEQLNAYSLVHPNVLSEKPFENGFILRRHNNPRVIQAMEDWIAHVFRYSRRDQLSLNYCLKNNALNLRAIDVDIRNSEYCRVLGTERNTTRARESALLSTISNYLAINSPSAELREKDKLIAIQTGQLKEIYDSRAWQLINRLWKIRTFLLPHNSKRESAAIKFLHFIRNVNQQKNGE